MKESNRLYYRNTSSDISKLDHKYYIFFRNKVKQIYFLFVKKSDFRILEMLPFPEAESLERGVFL